MSFHCLTTRAAKNEVLAAMAKKLYDAGLAVASGPNVERWPERARADIAEHVAIQTAIEQGDAYLTELARRHAEQRSPGSLLGAQASLEQ